jgi:carboxymethylenebutenolidase
MGNRETANLGAVLDEHLRAEFERRDADAAIATMAERPYLNHVPMLTGGVGREQVHRFYRDEWIPSWPDDTEVSSISRTVGSDRVIDELIVGFTHDRPMPFMLPGVEPTGRRVELPHVVVVGFEGDMIHHEHVYWDQGSLLVQVGLLEERSLPVTGRRQAHRMRELSSGRVQMPPPSP